MFISVTGLRLLLYSSPDSYKRAGGLPLAPSIFSGTNARTDVVRARLKMNDDDDDDDDPVALPPPPRPSDPNINWEAGWAVPFLLFVLLVSWGRVSPLPSGPNSYRVASFSLVYSCLVPVVFGREKSC